MFPNLKTATVSSNTMLGAGVHTVKAKSFEEKTTTKGLPYVEIICEDSTGAKTYLKFNGVDSNTSEAAARVRTEIFKKFLTTAGATTFNTVPTSVSSILNKTFQIVLAEREYWMNDKDTGTPTVRKAFDYKTSAPVGNPLTFNESMNKPLVGQELIGFQEAHNAHMLANSGSQGSTANSDLPF